MKKQAAMIAICAALLLCVAAAGCTSTTSSSPNASAAANSSSQTTTAAATATPTPTATATPTASPTATATPTASPTATATPTAAPTASPSGGTAVATVLYFHEIGCPYCAAFESTPSYAQLLKTGLVQSVLSTDTSMIQQYGVKSYPTVILLNSSGNVVGTYVNPTDATAILAQINAG
jgi:glucose/arabinose dehydrogenase